MNIPQLKARAEEYTNKYWHGLADTEDIVCVQDAFKDGAEFGYNKAKEEMDAQIEKMKCCHNCRKFNNLSYDCTCAEVCKEWELREE